MSGLTAQKRLSSMTRARPRLLQLGSGMKLKSATIHLLSNAQGLIQPCSSCAT